MSMVVKRVNFPSKNSFKKNNIVIYLQAGFTGKTCELQADPCDSSPCLNSGTCAGNATHFECACAAGFVGQLCQHNRDECASAPCIHGICVDQEDGYRCFCQPGKKSSNFFISILTKEGEDFRQISTNLFAEF